MSVPTYRVRNWLQHFETSESTKRKSSLPWVAIPTKHDGKSFRRLSRQPDADAIYGAWVLIVAVAGKCPVRGLLADEDGPLTPEDLEDKTGIPAASFEKAIQLLSSERFQWLVVDNLLEPAENSAGLLKTQPTIHNHTIHDITIRNPTEHDSAAGGVSRKFSLGRNANWKQIHTPAGAQAVFERALNAGLCTQDEWSHVFRLILSLDGTAKNPVGALISALRGEAGKDPWKSRGGDFEQQAKEWKRHLTVPAEMQERTSDLSTGPPSGDLKSEMMRRLAEIDKKKKETNGDKGTAKGEG